MENHEFWVLKNLLLSGFQIGPSFQVFIFRPETRGRLKCYIETRVWLTSLSYCTVIATMQCYIETINIYTVYYTETRGRLTSLSSCTVACAKNKKSLNFASSSWWHLKFGMKTPENYFQI